MTGQSHIITKLAGHPVQLIRELPVIMQSELADKMTALSLVSGLNM